MGHRAEILLVGAPEAPLSAVERSLSGIGAGVARAGSGREALRQIHEDVAVVLMDVRLPDGNGFETAALLRERAGFDRVPIIFMSADGEDVREARRDSLHPADFLHLPAEPEAVESKVRVLLEMRRETMKLRRQAERLGARAGQLAELNSQLLQVEERERRRLARMVHDDVQQLLAAARMCVQIAREGDDDSSIPEMMREVDDLIAQTIDAARCLVAELTPPVLDESGLAPCLEWLGRHMQKSCGLTLEIQADADAAPSELHRVFLFDAVRDLLLRAVKQSHAERVKLTLSEPSPGVVQIVLDDLGEFFESAADEAEGSTPGLSKLEEVYARLSSLGGAMRVEKAAATGTRVVLRLPTADSSTPGLVPTEAVQPSPRIEAAQTAKAESIRVLLADDHEIVRKGLKSLLQRQPDIEVVGEAADGIAAVELTHQLQPDVVVMDLSMPGIDGAEATRRVLADSPRVRVVGLSMSESENAEKAMRQAGAASYVPKGGPPENLIEAIRLCRRGETGPASDALDPSHRRHL